MNKERRIGVKAKRLFAVLVTMSALGTFRLDDDSWLYEVLTSTQGFVTPWGPVYLVEDPSEWIIEHELCHMDRIEEIGAIAFYADYVSGGACAEEIRCGADPDQHPACS